MNKQVSISLMKMPGKSFLSLVYVTAFWFLMQVPLALAQTPPTSSSVKLNNPLKVTTIEELLEAILGVVIVLATPVIVFFIIYAGFLYVTARGNPEQIKQASQALTYAVIGGVIVLGSFAIATIVGNIVAAF